MTLMPAIRAGVGALSNQPPRLVAQQACLTQADFGINTDGDALLLAGPRVAEVPRLAASPLTLTHTPSLLPRV